MHLAERRSGPRAAAGGALPPRAVPDFRYKAYLGAANPWFAEGWPDIVEDHDTDQGTLLIRPPGSHDRVLVHMPLPELQQFLDHVPSASAGTPPFLRTRPREASCPRTLRRPFSASIPKRSGRCECSCPTRRPTKARTREDAELPIGLATVTTGRWPGKVLLTPWSTSAPTSLVTCGRRSERSTGAWATTPWSPVCRSTALNPPRE